MNPQVPATAFPATAMPDSDWWHALWPHPLATIRALGIREDMEVLDLCCGDGYFTAAIAKCVTDHSVFGLDLDAAMLTEAEKACTAYPHCHFIQGNAMQLGKLLPNRVDFCLMANTFHGVPEQTELAGAVAHILKPGGYFAIINWYAQAREDTPVLGQARGPRTALRMTPEQVIRVVEPAGYRLVRVVKLPPYHYGAILQRAE